MILKEIDEEKKVEAIEAKYNASSASTAHKILRLGGLVSKLALTGAKKVTKTSVNALAKVSSTVLHTTGVSTKFTKSFLEPKRAAAVIKLPAHKRMAAARNEKFAIGLGSGESNLQVDVVNTNKIKVPPTQIVIRSDVLTARISPKRKPIISKRIKDKKHSRHFPTALYCFCLSLIHI